MNAKKKVGIPIKPGRPKIKPMKVPQAATRRVPCPDCDGTGKLKVRQQTFGTNGDVEEKQVELRCARCGGSGKWYE